MQQDRNYLQGWGIACFHSDFMVCEVANEANVETADSSTWRHNRLQILRKIQSTGGTLWVRNHLGRWPFRSGPFRLFHILGRPGWQCRQMSSLWGSILHPLFRASICSTGCSQSSKYNSECFFSNLSQSSKWRLCTSRKLRAYPWNFSFCWPGNLRELGIKCLFQFLDGGHESDVACPT